MLVILPSQASVYGRSQLRLESATAADSGDYHLYDYKSSQPLCILTNSGNYTCFIERGGEMLDSISYSLRVQGKFHPFSLLLWPLFDTRGPPPHGRSPPLLPCFSKWPACYFPTKPSVNKLHSSAQWSFLTPSSTEAAKYKGSQGDQQFHLIEVSIFIYLQMVIMIIIVIVIVIII